MRSSFKPKLIVCRVGNLYTTVRITQVLLVGNFWVKKKKSPKHIIMGSSFEDLVATGPTMKTNHKSDKRFDLQNILKFKIFYIKFQLRKHLCFLVLQLGILSRMLLSWYCSVGLNHFKSRSLHVRPFYA